MSVNQILSRLQYTMKKTDTLQIAHLLVEAGFPAAEMLRIALHQTSEYSFRAAWVFENMILHNDSYLEEVFDEFIASFPQVKHESVKRHMAKILNYSLERNIKGCFATDLLKRGTVQQWEALVEANFDWLLDEKVKIAVKAHCMDNLAYLSDLFPWIREELPPILEGLIEPAQPGISVRCRKVIKKMTEKTSN